MSRHCAGCPNLLTGLKFLPHSGLPRHQGPPRRLLPPSRFAPVPSCGHADEGEGLRVLLKA
jgi:hypothetical protein